MGNEMLDTLIEHQTHLVPDNMIAVNGEFVDMGEIRQASVTHLCDEDLVSKLFNTVNRYFQLDQGDSEETVRELIIEAVQNTDTNYGVAEAIEWGAGFIWDEERIASDLRMLKEADWDFIVMARQKLKLLADDRLSVERVLAL
jgi:beta-xylosidase